MLRQELTKVIPGVTSVVCFAEDGENPKYGWSDDMDDMIGKPFLVHEILPDGVILKHFSNRRYQFHYSILDIVKNEKYFKTTVENIPVSCINKLELSFFENNCNYEDYTGMKKILKTKRVLEFDKDTLADIQQQYPRVIGVMLSNNKLKKVG